MTSRGRSITEGGEVSNATLGSLCSLRRFVGLSGMGLGIAIRSSRERDKYGSCRDRASTDIYNMAKMKMAGKQMNLILGLK